MNQELKKIKVDEVKETAISTIKKKIVEWNSKHPYDHWWRTKYNIPFNSEQHRSMSLVDIIFQYNEHKLYSAIESTTQDDVNDVIKRFINGDKILTKKELQKIDEEDVFVNLDLTKLNGRQQDNKD